MAFSLTIGNPTWSEAKQTSALGAAFTIAQFGNITSLLLGAGGGS